MKKLLLLLFVIPCLFSTRLSASHVAGGEIMYDYIGDSTGIAHQYLVTVIMYRDKSGQYLPSSINLCISSSCYSSNTISMPSILTQQPVPTSAVCATDISDPNYVPVEYNLYQDTVVLPGKCADFRFNHYVCCRNFASTNISNPGSWGISIDASLNNMHGDNDSPVFQNFGISHHCVSSSPLTQYLINSSTENDGDSVHYEFNYTQLDGSCSATTETLPFSDTSLSSSQPFPSSPPIQLNPNTGTISFTPTQAGVNSLRLKLEEWRRDSTGQYLMVGSITRDAPLPILAFCRPGVSEVTFDLDTNRVFTDSLSCNDSVIVLQSNANLLGSQLASDGSQFTVFNAKGTVYPLSRAYPLDGSDRFTQLALVLNQPLTLNDTLFVSWETDSSLSFISTCGYPMNRQDTLQYVVKGCNSWVSQKEKAPSSISIFPNPATDKIQVRAAAGLQGATLEICDQAGKTLIRYRFRGSDEQEISIESLPRGSYLLQIKNANDYNLFSQSLLKL